MARRISDERIDHAVELIKSGSTLKNAAAVIGCDANELSKKLRTRGIPQRWRRAVPEDEIVALYTEGYGQGTIATKIGTTEMVVLRVLRTHNVKIRSAKEASRLREEFRAKGLLPKAPTKEAPEARIVELYLNGMGTPAVAKETGTTREIVTRVLRNNNIEIRTRITANQILASGRTLDQRREYIAAARAKRIENLVGAAATGSANHAIGPGEKEISEILREREQPFEQQYIIDGYLVDIRLGSLAIELKTSAVSAHISKQNACRFKKIIERGFTFIYLVTNRPTLLFDHADDLVAAFKKIERNPPARGEYWVIRCSQEQIGINYNVDHWSVEKRTPKDFDAMFEPD